ncbi:response regulator [Shewanella sp. NKUCC05_KAH]|uniref:hybrid sensor histidine kinase/response regulator n=1 Tax=Shewanella sp. NKUCC05_KAH TaxID=2842126 RepID=UPI001C5BB679|nr:hybrid sensor histidine kinase/response regulator [Shewanella sp. NKUCC05_KAH]MBW3528566.1 response regulator [Shewanella sp. NKUCC05_KAH]
MKSSQLNLRNLLCKYLKCSSLSDPDLPGRYSRWLLFSGGLAISFIVLTISVVEITILSERFLDERVHLFQIQRGIIKENLDRSQARLKQRVEFYEMLWRLRDGENLPVLRYRQELLKKNGVIVTDTDVTATPAMILSSSSHSVTDHELADFLGLMREVSPTPLLRQRENGHYLGGYIYSSDHRLLALWPPLSLTKLNNLKEVGINKFINDAVTKVDAVIATTNVNKLYDERMFWVPFYKSPITDELTTNYAAPVYCDGKLIAVIVVNVPISKFSMLFQSSTHETGFFVVSSDRKHIFGVDNYSPSESRWAKYILEYPALLQNTALRRDITYRDGMFFVSQFIQGPNWIAVYVFDWFTIFNALKSKLITLSILTFLVLGILWGFILLLDRLILAPLRIQSRLVYESDAFNHAVLNTAPVGLSIYDPFSNKVVMQNEAAECLLLPSECVNFYSEILVKAQLNRHKNQSELQSNVHEVQITEASVLSACGEQREISVAYSHIRYQQREVILFSLTDISAQKTTVRLLEQAREMADQANQAKSMFIAMMSHEIRTPLHGALGNLELLALEPLTLEQKARVSTINRAFDALLALINDILDLSKIEAQELQLHPEPFQLIELVERCAQTFAPVILDKNLRFFCLIDPELTGTWSGDGHRLSQVLMNLVSNARKFTEEGSITIRAIPGEVRDDIRWVRISVSDTGIGISHAHINKVFEPFVQADRSINSRFGGTGLGLTLCRRIMTLMGGNITVDSEEGEGSIFTINVPLRHNLSYENRCQFADKYRFSTVVIVCDSPLWQFNLIEQFKCWIPDVEIIEASLLKPLPAPRTNAVIVFATSGTALSEPWRDILYTYLDTVILSSDGPLYPERRNQDLCVTSFSTSMFKLILAACGKHDEVLEPLTVRQQRSEIHHYAKVLIAEDDPLNRTLLEHQLAALGYHYVDSVGDGQQALEYCSTKPYDIIVTDLGMPQMDGFEFLKAIRAKGINTPVIVSTADINGITQIKAAGIAEVLHKPITIERLNRTLEHVLGKVMSDSQEISMKSLSTVTLIDMQALFVAGWNSDEQGLLDALDANDGKRFLGYLHRLKGALLALDEKSLVASIDILRRHIESQGLAQNVVHIDVFMEKLRSLVILYSKNKAYLSSD